MKINGNGQAKILTPQEIEALFNPEIGLKTPRDRALFGICTYTGCRINEACTLFKGDVISGDGMIRHEITIRKVNTKGERKTRQIPTSPELVDLLEEYREVVQGRGIKSHLFPGRHGRGHISPESAYRILQEAYSRIGVEGASTHSFRRTAITRMHNAGVPIRHIQEISGHDSLQALQRYIEVSEQDKKNAIATISYFPAKNRYSSG